MSEGTVSLFVCGALGLAIGGALWPVWRRHRRRMAKARRAEEFIPRIDARGIWLVLNGPATLVLGVGLVVVASWNAKVELDEERRVGELMGIDVRCVPEHVTFELVGREPRRVDVRLARVLLGSSEGSTVLLSPSRYVALEPGTPRTLDARLVEPDACGNPSFVVFEPFAPRATGPWPECDGMRFTLVIRDADGAERATGERECALRGR